MWIYLQRTRRGGVGGGLGITTVFNLNCRDIALAFHFGSCIGASCATACVGDKPNQITTVHGLGAKITTVHGNQLAAVQWLEMGQHRQGSAASSDYTNPFAPALATSKTTTDTTAYWNVCSSFFSVEMYLYMCHHKGKQVVGVEAAGFYLHMNTANTIK